MAKRNNFVAGLAGLLQGVNDGAQQSFVNKVANTELGWKDPNRALTQEELDRLAAEAFKSGTAYQMAYQAPGTVSLPQILASFRLHTNQALNPAGYSVDTGEKNQPVPTMGIQGLPGPSAPAGPSTPAAPIAVSRGGYTPQDLIDYARKQGWAK
jgi:hypothetical protein